MKPAKGPVIAGLMGKLRKALEAIKSRVPKGNLPRLEALRAYINRMKVKDPNAPRKVDYHGGVFKLGKIASWTPLSPQVSDYERMREAWEKGVKDVLRLER